MNLLIELINDILDCEGSYFEIEVLPQYADKLRHIKNILEELMR